MGNTTLRNARKIFTGSGGDASLPDRVLTLENNEYKITYYEIISGASGSLTLPAGATINAGEFGLSGNCVLSKIDGSNKPTFESPKTSGGTIVTASLNETTGAWVASGVYTDSFVALIYSIKIKAIYYSNLTYNNIIETVNLNGITKFSYTDTVLGTATSGTGNQFSKSVLIPANTLTSGALNIKGRAVKSGSSSYGWLNIYINTANNLSGAAHLGQINSAGGNTLANFAIDRTIPIQSGSFVTFIVNTTNGFEEIVTNQVSTTTIDWTVDQYVILSCQCNVGTDTMRANFLSVNQF